MRHRAKFVLITASLLLIGGCTVHPAGESSERQAAMQAGAPFQKAFADRSVPRLPASPTADDLVRYALLNNSDLERRYWEWRSAIEQIPQDGTPQTTLAINAAAGITRGGVDLANSELSAQNMPSNMIPWPGKISAAGRRALESARAAGLRFRKAQFDLRAKALNAWDDYALDGEMIRLEQAKAALLETTAAVAEARGRAGAGSQAEVLKALNELGLSRNQILARQAQLPADLAKINALLGRPAGAAIPVPAELPPCKPVRETDGQLLALAAQENPELAVLSHEIAARRDGLELARLQYFPDFAVNFEANLTGVVQSLAGMVSVPLLRHEAIDAAIVQAQANLRSAEAMRLQIGNDMKAEIIGDICTLRDADRQLELLEKTILPRARQVVVVARSAYEAGESSLLDLLDDERSLISIERLIADLRIVREKRLADLEAVTGCDLSSAHLGSTN